MEPKETVPYQREHFVEKLITYTVLGNFELQDNLHVSH